MAQEDTIPTLQGTWFNDLDPFWGYLKFEDYKSISEGGECVAIVHCRHGRNEPPIWYRGVWKPTPMGFEAIAGPYHWKNIAVFSIPASKDRPQMTYFRSNLNGWGWCNMGRLADQEEQKFVDQLSALPVWQEVKSFWSDYPYASWAESQKYLQPIANYNGPPASLPKPLYYPENYETHNGGQTLPPQGGGLQPQGAAEPQQTPPQRSDGPDQGPQQSNVPQTQDAPPPETNRTQG